MRLLLLGCLSLAVFFWNSAPLALATSEEICFVMFGPDVVEDKTEVLSSLEPFVNWLNARMPFKLTAFFFKSASPMNQFMQTHRVGLAMVDMSYFLEQRKKFNLVPLLKPLVHDQDTFQIVVIKHKNSQAKNILNLQGKKVSILSRYPGTYRFYNHIVFKDQIQVERDFQLVYTKTAYAALIDVMNRLTSAAIVWSNDYSSLCELNPAARRDLQILTSSEIYPFHPLVYLPSNLNPEQVQQLKDVLLKQNSSAEGRQLLMLFKYEGWHEVAPEEYDALIQQQAAPPSRRRGKTK